MARGVYNIGDKQFHPLAEDSDPKKKRRGGV